MIDPYTDFINFGKYNGLLYDNVAEIEPSYIVWVDENVKHIKLPKSYVDAIRWDIMEEEELFLDAWESWMSWND